MLKPKEIVHQKMFNEDAFSQWLGITIDYIEAGHCKLTMTVRQEMLNGFKIGHGGITYSLCDSAFAFASNSRGQMAVSIETSISHVRPIFEGDRLTAIANELSRGRRTGIYEVTATNQENKVVALFKGTVFIKDAVWE